MEIASHIPVLDTPLEKVQGLPPTFVFSCMKLGYRNIYGLIDWADEPDENGRIGLSKLRSLPHVGPARMQRIDQSLVAIGVDLSR